MLNVYPPLKQPPLKKRKKSKKEKAITQEKLYFLKETFKKFKIDGIFIASLTLHVLLTSI